MPKELRVSYEPKDVDFAKVFDWIAIQSYWAQGRSEETVRTSIENSLNISIFDDQDKFIGFGRVVTDGATFGWLCDVFVDPNERGNGAGKAIAQAAVEYFKDVPNFRMLLKTKDAHEIYRSVGFSEVPDPDKWMTFFNNS